MKFFCFSLVVGGVGHGGEVGMIVGGRGCAVVRSGALAFDETGGTIEVWRMK